MVHRFRLLKAGPRIGFEEKYSAWPERTHHTVMNVTAKFAGQMPENRDNIVPTFVAEIIIREISNRRYKRHASGCGYFLCLSHANARLIDGGY